MRIWVLLLLVAGAIQARQLGGQLAVALQLRPNGSYLGVAVSDIDPGRAQMLKLDSEHGVEVVRVTESSPADKAGFRPRDVLLTYNGETILGAQQLGRLVWETPPGRHVKIQYLRDGKVSSAVALTALTPTQTTGIDEQRSWSGGLTNGVMDVPVPLIAWRNLVLGIECEPIDTELAEYFGVRDGILVRSVEKGSVSDKSGLKPGDVIVTVSGRGLSSPRDLSSCLREQSEPGKPVPLGVVRGRKSVTLNLVLPAAQ